MATASFIRKAEAAERPRLGMGGRNISLAAAASLWELKALLAKASIVLKDADIEAGFLVAAIEGLKDGSDAVGELLEAAQEAKENVEEIRSWLLRARGSLEASGPLSMLAPRREG